MNNPSEIEKDKLEPLLQRDIIDVLIGDATVNSNMDVESASLPYMSGNDIRDLGFKIGLPPTPDTNGTSRWNIFMSILSHAIGENKVYDLFKEIFSKSRFKSLLIKSGESNFESNYSLLISSTLNAINIHLHFSEIKLVFSGDRITIQSRNKLIIESETLSTIISSQYIKDLPSRMKDSLGNGDYDTVITRCRTLLEEVFIHVITQFGEKPNDNGNIKSLYSQCARLLNMQHSNSLDKRVTHLLGGLQTIVDSVAELRNKNSDSHGVGNSRIPIHEHHAVLVMNSVMTYCEFLLNSYEYQKSRKQRTHL